MKQSIDQVEFELKEMCDFSFLERYGKVFKVFDQNDSGNISFAVENKKKKYFVKVAGAKTKNGLQPPSEAIRILKESSKIYQDLEHPTLIHWIESFMINELFVCVFEWVEGECLHDHWNFDYYREHTLQRPSEKFIQLPTQEKLRAYQCLLDFMLHISEKNYVAIDLYLGSLIYDFESKSLKVCDIDYFAKKPFVNTMGRLWGSGSVMSPEEFVKGSLIDETSNVYTLAKMAIIFFQEKETEHWTLSKTLFKTVNKALLDNRQKRGGIKEYVECWMAE